MDEDSRLLDELAAAAETESGDAKKAWRLLAARIDTADLPIWVREYFQKAARHVDKFDPQEHEPADLTRDLGLFREQELRPSGYDYDHIFDWFVDRITEQAKSNPDTKFNLSKLAREYNAEVWKMNEQ